jgi:hypothetical protein
MIFGKLLRYLSIVMLFAALLVGCKSSPEPTDSPLRIPAADSPLPAPTGATTVETLPQITEVPLVPPTPAPGKGIVIGVLLRDNLGLPLEAMTKTRLYLGPVKTTTGGERFVSHSANVDPVTFTGEDGTFIFTDIEPGSYGLIVATPISSVLMRHHDSGEEVVFTVEAGETVDLGELHFLSPL